MSKKYPTIASLRPLNQLKKYKPLPAHASEEQVQMYVLALGMIMQVDELALELTKLKSGLERLYEISMGIK